ncbi:FG-GAP-like repeat-containing protein [Winogradskyella maritima]|uniref:FG-GAP-like repeat-containing protein n=1 Tax=Winogradskyella maritima TaxID=1517766 RepID=A0ABV8AFV3_9FLAO|nr:FG-GAP-like repeat-containing protein [Winogradskyella maritima]
MNRILLGFALCSVSFISNAQIRFENTAVSRGVDFSCGAPFLGGGVSFFDFNDDGFDDLSFATESGAELAFFQNIDGLGFVTINLNLRDTDNNLIDFQAKQINWVDIDNDGDKDLFVTSDEAGNKLFKNTGNLIFEDITVTAGFPTTDLNSFGASWGDYNNDGFLDVFISSRDPMVSSFTPNYLYKNNGDSTFTDVSVEAGIDRSKHVSFCSAWIDINNDGFQDLYISNDKRAEEFHKNQLYKNNGDGTFTDISASSGTDLLIDAMTVTVGDYNRDGFFDIYVTNAGECVLLKNNGDETFTDVAPSTGTDLVSFTWGAIFLDGDNDADLDLYVSSSLFQSSFPSAAFFENDGNSNFSIPTMAGFDNDEGRSHSNATGDLNNDGLTDFVVTNTDDQDIVLWENKNTENNNWLKVKLQGTTSNRDGIGSVIEISSNGQQQYHYTNCGEGYLGQNSATETFGIGNATLIDYVKVTWLSGLVETYRDINPNQTLFLIEGNTLSLNETAVLDFTLHPNPVTDILKLKSKVYIEFVKLYESTGKIIKHFKVNSYEKHIDVSLYQSGIYFLEAMTSSGPITQRFLKH